MSGVLSLFKSRKFWITILGVVITLSQGAIGLTDSQVMTIAGILALLFLAIAHEDRGKILKNILDGVEVKIPDEEGKGEYSFRVDLKKVIDKVEAEKKA
jgi:hypothetical protein